MTSDKQQPKVKKNNWSGKGNFIEAFLPLEFQYLAMTIGIGTYKKL